jgi:chromosome segregation ATPase
MNKDQIKQNFQTSLQRLGEINTAIEANIRGKQEFSARIIQRLSEINDKVKQLGDAIKTLKDQLTDLQGQAAANNSQITDIGTEVNGLKAQIAQLTDQRDKAVAELDALKNKFQADTQDFQKRIDECEEKLRQLQDQNVAITQQRDALQAELGQTGEQGAAHAVELKKLTDQHTQELQQKDEQLKAQQDANAAAMKQLQDEIAAKEVELNQRTVDVGNNAAQLQAQIDQLTREKEAKNAQIAQLQADIAALQTENDDLIARIVAATQAIADATNRLRELNDPATFNEAELDAKFQELEASVQQISNAIQGNPVANNQAAAGQIAQGQASTGQSLDKRTPIVYEGQNLVLANIINTLQSKPQVDRVTKQASKYALALRGLRAAQTPEEVIQALTSNGVHAKNGAVYGGKKTKKNRKQKGGYTYKSNLKRRSISTTSSIRSSASGRGIRHTKRR